MSKDRPYYEQRIETMQKKDLQALQFKRLKKVLNKAYRNSVFYQDLFREHGVLPRDITTLSEIRHLPFTDKETVRNAYPFGLLIAPVDELREVHTTSGTTGVPIPTFVNDVDIQWWGRVNARSLWMVGLRPGDILQNAYGYGMPTGGFGFHYGAIRLGATVIPIGIGLSERQIDLMVDFGVNAICMTPSYALYLSHKAKERGITLSECKHLRMGLFGAEPWSTSTRAKLETAFGIDAFDEYGMTELLGPGMACECKKKNGMHVWSDAFIVECIDPDTDMPVKEGEVGELVWTGIVSDAVAFIRYRSRDLASLTWKKCGCGRTHPRISSIKGRADDAVSISGVIVFPSQIEQILFGTPNVGHGFRMVIGSDKQGMDNFKLEVELADSSMLGNPDLLRETENYIRKSIKNIVDVRVAVVEFMPPNFLPRAMEGEGKASSTRVIDCREK